MGSPAPQPPSLGADHGAACSLKRRQLGIKVLVRGGDPGVARRHGHRYSGLRLSAFGREIIAVCGSHYCGHLAPAEAMSEGLAPAGEEGEARVRGGAVSRFAGPDRAEAKLAGVRPPPVPAGRDVDLPAGGREAGTVTGRRRTSPSLVRPAGTGSVASPDSTRSGCETERLSPRSLPRGRVAWRANALVVRGEMSAISPPLRSAVTVPSSAPPKRRQPPRSASPSMPAKTASADRPDSRRAGDPRRSASPPQGG